MDTHLHDPYIMITFEQVVGEEVLAGPEYEGPAVDVHNDRQLGGGIQTLYTLYTQSAMPMFQ